MRQSSVTAGGASRRWSKGWVGLAAAGLVVGVLAWGGYLKGGLGASPGGHAPGGLPAVTAAGAPSLPSGPSGISAPGASPPTLGSSQTPSEAVEEKAGASFEEAADQLAQELVQAGVDPEQLKALGEDLSEEEMILAAPAAARPALERFRQRIQKIRESLATEEGVDESFFEREKATLPPQAASRAEALKHVALQPEVARFVRTKARAQRITDPDVEALLTLCHRQKDCVEASAIAWIDAHHLLTEQQILKLGQTGAQGGRN